MSQLNQPPTNIAPELETVAFETSEIVAPVLQEQLEVHKAMHTTASFRIQKIVREVEEVINEPLASETLDVERIPIDRPVESAPPVRTEGDVTIVPVIEEVLIVTKQLRHVEELRITRAGPLSNTSRR